MIDKDRIDGCRKYTCDGIKCDGTKCGAIAHFKNYDEARDNGWSVSYWRDKCYCQKCAPNYKNVGSAGVKESHGEQLSFDKQ